MVDIIEVAKTIRVGPVFTSALPLTLLMLHISVCISIATEQGVTW